MTDMRRTLLWVVFLMSIALLWDAWNKHNGHPSMFGGQANRPAATAPATTGPAGTPATGVAAAAVPGGAAAVAPSEIVVVTTDLLKASFDSRGARLIRLELLKEKEQITHAWYQPFTELFSSTKAKASEAPNVVLLDLSPSHVYVAETGLLNVPNPLTHFSSMKVLPGDRALKDGSDDVSVSFASADEGVKLVKTFVLHRGKYTVDVRHELQNLGDKPVPAPQIYLQLTRDGTPLPGGSSFYSTFTGPALYTESSKYVKADFKDIDKNSVKYERNADNGWVAIVQHYFTTAWLHNDKQAREFSVRATEAKDSEYGRHVYSVSEVFTLPALAPGATTKLDSVFFGGPQEENSLSVLAPGLELVKDYGIFKLLAEPLFWLLTQLHKVLGNWGWSIIALVVLLRIAFYWLNVSAYRSMAKMKAINPKITEMRERLKDKPQQMQQEMMRIYREEKINPLGGCLPILVQMPFFISLYWVLLSSVEMRHAPWMLWITDLSAADPYFILPVLMTLSSLLQTWLNPTPPDPVQAKMMWIMPLAFSVMFFVFPAGLVLYWLTNNVLAIAQQWLINKQLGVLGK
jgi:YidC/Oxa1 family membrane protein insertase